MKIQDKISNGEYKKVLFSYDKGVEATVAELAKFFPGEKKGFLLLAVKPEARSVEERLLNKSITIIKAYFDENFYDQAKELGINSLIRFKYSKDWNIKLYCSPFSHEEDDDKTKDIKRNERKRLAYFEFYIRELNVINAESLPNDYHETILTDEDRIDNGTANFQLSMDELKTRIANTFSNNDQDDGKANKKNSGTNVKSDKKKRNDVMLLLNCDYNQRKNGEDNKEMPTVIVNAFCDENFYQKAKKLYFDDRKYVTVKYAGDIMYSLYIKEPVEINEEYDEKARKDLIEGRIKLSSIKIRATEIEARDFY